MKHRAYAIVRIWPIAIIGLASGVIGDAGTEFFTSGDTDHQGMVPALAIAVLLALGLAVYLACSRIGPRDPLLCRFNRWRDRLPDALAAFGASWLTVIGIEGYETHFGGIEPFDTRSVVIAHAPLLLLAFLAVALTAQVILAAALRWAARSGAVAVALVRRVLRVSRHAVATTTHAGMAFLEAVCKHDVPELISACGPRAPPRMSSLVIVY